ncbi:MULTISPECIES: accessory gene regulator ArgB-like protein [unclassified Paenibacillus]|uniref:accessory gene regulator ArgB-like protein n=2 Tax=Paenibacillus TaxID=44249 RepID=UPI0024B995FB|nr:accessory gene regulator B family protein [Paenibacillus sp. RC334]
MLEALSRHIATEIKKADPDGPTSVEVMEYALGIKITEVSAVFLVAVVGWMAGHFLGALLALGTIMFMRRFSGGAHFRNLTLCVCFTTAICVTIPFIALNVPTIFIISACSLLVFVIYAPNHFIYINKTTKHKYYKAVCILFCALNFFIQSHIICLSLAIQAFSILPLWKGGERKWTRDWQEL